MFNLLNPYKLARSVLFSMDAEKAHHLTLQRLKEHYQNPLLRPFIANQIAPLPTKIMGLTVKKPCGFSGGTR